MNLNGQAFNSNGKIISNLYSVGEAAGFEVRGMHGYQSLEGTFFSVAFLMEFAFVNTFIK